ncbi:hypothetical protein GDO78_023134 [Eleutherodactylus coqui]|uniref:Uncharacterized protein n=1 Tax=Eleutherodactylus coqui TaxID=57060 RepID=A0A8J6JRA2_ELECQ|nr:hypothetical protein GDO78_023134 [Eleutherodactylus coqui]
MHGNWKNMLPLRSYFIGILVVFMLFIMGFCIKYIDLMFQPKPTECSLKAVEKSIELAHCERKLLINTGNGR